MFTKQSFRELDPDLTLNIIPLHYPPSPCTVLLTKIAQLIAEEYPSILVDTERGIIHINTRMLNRPF